jgi:hypothetical protein
MLAVFANPQILLAIFRCSLCKSEMLLADLQIRKFFWLAFLQIRKFYWSFCKSANIVGRLANPKI